MELDRLEPWPLFVDSGAHSLYTKHVLKAIPKRLWDRVDKYAWYRTQEFKDYVDEYAQFIKRTKPAYYATVDCIFEPELSWKVLKYLENKHGLTPVPVVHFNAPMEVLQRHINDGYDYIGIGGLGQEAKKAIYVGWADRVFNIICDTPNRMPKVRTHGFAIGSPYLMKRYPWWSIDSASWVKSAGFGKIFIPRKVGGEWNFKKHFAINVSRKSPSAGSLGQHVFAIPKAERDMIEEWLGSIGVSLGDMTDDQEKDVVSATNHRSARIKCNLEFYYGLARSLPWPRPFKAMSIERFGMF